MTLTLARPLLAAVAPDLTTHAHSHGPIPWQHVPHLIATAKAAGLTGRGGAGFPVWRKLSAVSQASHPVVVANGGEGEPASHKDAYLLANAPHLILDGLQLAAATVAAREAYLYAPAASLSPIRTALFARVAMGWDRLPVKLVEAPASFIAGQESAVWPGAGRVTTLTAQRAWWPADCASSPARCKRTFAAGARHGRGARHDAQTARRLDSLRWARAVHRVAAGSP